MVVKTSGFLGNNIGFKTSAMKIEPPDRAGVGAGSNCHAHRPSQSFNAFSATSTNGQVVFRDSFECSPDDLLAQWHVAALPSTKNRSLACIIKAPLVVWSRLR